MCGCLATGFQGTVVLLREFQVGWFGGVVSGEGRRWGLDGPCPSMTDASGTLAAAPFHFHFKES